MTPHQTPLIPPPSSTETLPDTRGADPLAMDLYGQPGHLIRRAQQIAVSMFHQTVQRDVTPVQYAILQALHQSPGIDQVTLAQKVALDTSTTAEIAARLEAKGWILREVLPRRQRRLALTPAGLALLGEVVPGVKAMQRTLLASFDQAEQQEFLRLLRKFVHLNNEQSRAPLRLDKPAGDE